MLVKGSADKAIIWSTSNSEVAEIDQAGRLTAIIPGSAVIIATSTFDPTKNHSIKVVVAEAPRRHDRRPGRGLRLAGR